MIPNPDDNDVYRCDKTQDMFDQVSNAAKDYVDRQFVSAVPKVNLTKPAEGFLKCCVCGVVASIEDDLSYEDQSCCYNPDCDGQMFCHVWPRWLDSNA